MRKLTRFQFLAERQKWRDEVTKHKGPNDIVCDPGNEIICDLCNNEARTDDDCVILIGDKETGEMVVCPVCSWTIQERGKK